jgi:Zn finger protein HypA/HybF involved in hydrogenase expression
VADSVWPQAAVRIRREPLALRCRACGRRYEPPETDLRCPGCKAADVETLQGKDLRLESLEVE